jgi:hypothetical protein
VEIPPATGSTGQISMFRAMCGVNLGSAMGEVTNPVGEVFKNFGKSGEVIEKPTVSALFY